MVYKKLYEYYERKPLLLNKHLQYFSLWWAQSTIISGGYGGIIIIRNPTYPVSLNIRRYEQKTRSDRTENTRVPFLSLIFEPSNVRQF